MTYLLVHQICKIYYASSRSLNHIFAFAFIAVIMVTRLCVGCRRLSVDLSVVRPMVLSKNTRSTAQLAVVMMIDQSPPV